jgi:HTH-type transcriptional regulator / antitoxin HigA
MTEIAETEVRPIRTDQDYERALAEIRRLFDAPPGSPEYDRLEVLSILVEAYEEAHYPMPLPDPIEAIEYFIESRGLSEKDLEPCIGTRARVWEVLNRRRPLTLRMIRNLESAFGIPAGILIQDYQIVDGSKADSDGDAPGTTDQDLGRTGRLVRPCRRPIPAGPGQDPRIRS